MDKIIKADFDALDKSVKFNFISINEGSSHRDYHSTRALYARASDSQRSSKSGISEHDVGPTMNLGNLATSSKFVNQGSRKLGTNLRYPDNSEKKKNAILKE